jgi:hypothetical protein
MNQDNNIYIYTCTYHIYVYIYINVLYTHIQDWNIMFCWFYLHLISPLKPRLGHVMVVLRPGGPRYIPPGWPHQAAAPSPPNDHGRAAADTPAAIGQVMPSSETWGCSLTDITGGKLDHEEVKLQMGRLEQPCHITVSSAKALLSENTCCLLRIEGGKLRR